MDDLTPEQTRALQTSLAPTRAIKIINAADVTPNNPAFLWRPYLPLGQVVIVAGAPGHGKSQLAALMTGLASRGALHGDLYGDPSRVLMMCAEDDLASTVVPRLMAVNADLREVDFINVVTEHPSGLTSTGMIRLPGDVGPVHQWAKKYVTARLVVMDPVASFFDRSHSTISNQDVRDAFEPMVAIAQTYGITVVIIMHLNKNESRDFTARIAESHGFQALARSVMALGPDPDDQDGSRGAQKVFTVTKANLVKPGTYGMRCEVRSVTLSAFTPPIETSELVLLGKCEISADDLLMPTAERTTRIEAAEWLAEFVGEVWIKVSDVKKAAISDGWSWRTIERLRRDQGYQKAKQTGVEYGPWWMAKDGISIKALGSTHTRTGGLEDLVGLDGASSDTQDRQDTQDRPSGGVSREDSWQKEVDLDEYRRLRDRMLGERDDDEEDGADAS